MTRGTALIATGVMAALLAGSAAYVLLGRGDTRFAQCDGGQVVGGGDAIGGPFTLVAETGDEVTEAEVIEDLTLIYFGYTFCPDVCPFDVARNAEAVEILDERGIAIKPVMVSIDPTRDTPEVMADFTEAMHPRMLGLTGSEAQVEGAKTAYRVYGARAEGQAEDEQDYLVDHSTFSYLMHPTEGFLGFFRRDVSPEEMADRIACFSAAL